MADAIIIAGNLKILGNTKIYLLKCHSLNKIAKKVHHDFICTCVHDFICTSTLLKQKYTYKITFSFSIYLQSYTTENLISFTLK